MRASALRASAAALVIVFGACSAPEPTLNADLERDLAAVHLSSVELAPRAAGRTAVVSAEELVPRRAPVARVARSQPRAAPARLRVTRVARAAPARRPAVAAPVEAPVTVGTGPEVGTAPADDVIERSEPIVSGPLRRPVERTPEPPGGYRSVSDVIRNAPFPINP